MKLKIFHLKLIQVKYIASFSSSWKFDDTKNVLKDRRKLKCLIMYHVNAGNAGAGAGRCQFMFQTLHATSQDGSSLESVVAIACMEYNILDARGRWLCQVQLQITTIFQSIIKIRKRFRMKD